MRKQGHPILNVTILVKKYISIESLIILILKYILKNRYS